MKKCWFSLYDNNEYKGKEEPYYEISEWKGIKELKEKTEVIYKECLDFISRHEMESHFNVTMVEKPMSWKVRSLRVWGVEMYAYQKFFPETMRYLSDIDNVVNIGFNLLCPGAIIKAHQGDTNAILRCHLGLEVPKEKEKCYLSVKEEKKYWEKGEIIAFMDAYTHYAVNESSERRIILLFDLLNPRYVNKKNLICATVLTSFYMQQMGNYFPFLYSVPRRFFRLFLFPMVKFIQWVIPVRNWMKKSEIYYY